MRTKSLTVLWVGLLALSACGATPLTAATTEQTTAPAAAAGASPGAAVGVAASLGSSALGEIIVGERGLTLYGFTNDTDAKSTCSGTCADAWPPLIVGPDWTVAPGLDSGIFATTTREDGQLQLVAGKWPLYYFAGDTNSGDLKGQGSGDVWFAVNADGSLINEAVPSQSDGGAASETSGPLLATAESSIGQILTDASGRSLYGFTDDSAGAPTCVDACADAWPPIVVTSPELPADLDPAVFSVVERPDGTLQLKAGTWPLYRFAGDGEPGQAEGQGSGGVWFLVAPDGSLVGVEQADTSPQEDEDDGY